MRIEGEGGGQRAGPFKVDLVFEFPWKTLEEVKLWTPRGEICHHSFP